MNRKTSAECRLSVRFFLFFFFLYFFFFLFGSIFGILYTILLNVFFFYFFFRLIRGTFGIICFGSSGGVGLGRAKGSGGCKWMRCVRVRLLNDGFIFGDGDLKIKGTPRRLVFNII